MSFTPREYSFATPQDLGGKAPYRIFCSVVGLEPVEGGYGFLHGEYDRGRRATRVTTDVDYLRMLVEAEGADALGDLELPADKFPMERDGWPDEWGRR